MRHDSKPPGGASKHISKRLAARDSVGVLCLAEVAYARSNRPAQI